MESYSRVATLVHGVHVNNATAPALMLTETKDRLASFFRVLLSVGNVVPLYYSVVLKGFWHSPLYSDSGGSD